MNRARAAASSSFGIFISGRGSNMVSLVEASLAGRIPARAALVISNVAAAPGLDRARKLGVETACVDHRETDSPEAHDHRVLELLRRRDVRLVCLAGYMRLLSPVLLDALPLRIMNIHPSLLPAFPGLHAQRQALEYGVKQSGCTVHFVDSKVDHGPVILQASVDVRDDDTEESLSARILEQEHRLYPEAVRLLFEDRLHVDGRRVRIGSAAAP